MMFPPWLLSIAVHAGLVLVVAGALTLAGLWLSDLLGRRLW